MSILNVNKINPVGGGSTITIAGIASITGNATATTFIGALTGTASGNTTITNNADNRVVTGGSGNALNGESTLTHNGGVLSVNDPSLSTDAKIIVKGNDTNNHDIITAYSNTSTRGSFAIRNGTGIAPSFLVGTRGGSETLGLMTNGTERVRIDTSGNLKFNSGYGSVNTAYGIRAWIAFKAAGGSNTVRGSGNATITDHGTGDFTMNFTTAMPDTGYSAVGTAGYNSGIIVLGLTGSGTESAPTTSGFRFSIRANYSNSTLMDEEYVNLMVVR